MEVTHGKTNNEMELKSEKAALKIMARKGIF